MTQQYFQNFIWRNSPGDIPPWVRAYFELRRKNIEDIVKWGFLLLLCFSYRGSLLCAFNFTKAFFLLKNNNSWRKKISKNAATTPHTPFIDSSITHTHFWKKNSSIFTTFLYNYIPIHSAMQYDLHFSHHQEGRA